MRFVGQAFEISVPIELKELDRLTTEKLAERFIVEHRRVYLHGGEPGREIELVGLRYSARQKLDDLPLAQERVVSMVRPSKSIVTAPDGSETHAKIIPASELIAGQRVPGPTLIEGYSSTIWVPPGWYAERDLHNNTWLRKLQ
jgi:N-methylhydantoinase A